VTASLNDRFHRSLTHVFDRPKSESDASASFVLLLNSEIIAAIVDIWRQHFYAHVVAFRNIHGAFFVVVLPGREQRCHILDRIVIFQVSGFDCNHAVICGMAFIETVMRKGFPMGKDIFSGLSLNAIFYRAFNELFAVLFDFLDLLFRDCRT